MTNPKLNLMVGLVAGSIAGAITAVLYAPKSGRLIRKRISHKTDELLTDARRYLGTVKTKASDIISDGRRKMDSLSREVSKIYNRGSNNHTSQRTSKHANSGKKTHAVHK
jgi:gas vesicle protein